LIVFLAELNGLSLWGADVSSAYLKAITQGKVYFTAGPEFGDKIGHTMVVNKALYGLRSSEHCWHEKFAVILQSIWASFNQEVKTFGCERMVIGMNILVYTWMT
jgi:Reverse transcriptase (RNA-dependent DNA polymerase)